MKLLYCASNPHHLQELQSWKVLCPATLQCVKLTPSGWNGVRGTEDTWNMILFKWLINTKLFCLFLLDWWCSWLKVVRVIECCKRIWQRGKHKTWWWKRWSLFCLLLYTSLYCAMTASISWLNYRHMSINWLTSKKWLSYLPSGDNCSEHW